MFLKLQINDMSLKTMIFSYKIELEIVYPRIINL